MSLDISQVTARVLQSTSNDVEWTCSQLSHRHADLAESEIELMLLVAFDLLNVWNVDFGSKPTIKIVKSGDAFSFEDAMIIVEPQYQWDNYRIDFSVKINKLPYPIFIECDGHDFHERTKEQAERDRSRDRAIQASGIPVLRFTGREIGRSPADCVNQILKFVVDRLALSQGAPK